MLGDAENYSETPITMETKLAGEIESFVFILQRAGKLTPHQARLAAEERADGLARRLADHAHCDRHPETAPDADCAHCGDRSAYLTYLQAGGRDYRDWADDPAGEGISLLELRRRTRGESDE